MENGNLYEMPQLGVNSLRAVDLFCGAGIGAYGIKRAGYDIVWGVDTDKDAVKTYNINIGNHAICDDIRNIKKVDIPEHDLMIATPVCKPFSVCGSRRLTDDEKYGDLLGETIRLLRECRPKACFFENVAGIVIGDSLPVFLDFVGQIESYGYYTYWDTVNSWDLGVPQERVRVFLVAIRDDIKHEFIVPKKLLFGKKTQRDAFYDLKDKTIADVKNHNADTYNFGHFHVSSRQTGWDSPGLTVMSTFGGVLCYPEPFIPFNMSDYDNRYKFIEDNNIRRLSVRECLRLQTVGDDFYFPDDISLVEQYNRCSGVPSLVAYKYGIAIADCLLGKTPIRKKVIRKRALF